MNLTDLNAQALHQAIHSREVSCVEVLLAYLEHIQTHNPQFNALVSLHSLEARDHHPGLLSLAQTLDEEMGAGQSRGFLHGMPMAPKDLAFTKDCVTTLGSPLLRHNLPKEDALVVQRMRQSGALFIGKSNTPEFGLGSHTYNSVFGTTRNAYHPHLSAGGSSGGAAVALALHMLPLADGSDFMGSLRNPAGWNNVYGLRPSQGRVPSLPASEQFISQLGTEGPMARCIEDLARLLMVQAGPSAEAPLSLAERREEFNAQMEAALSGEPTPLVSGSGPDRPYSVGWLGDLGGHLAYEVGVAEQCQVALKRFEALGARVEEVRLWPAHDPTKGQVLGSASPSPRGHALGLHPDQVWHAWLTLRSALVAHRLGALAHVPHAQEHMKAEVLWELEYAQGLSAADLLRASTTRTQLYHHLLALLKEHDVLALPSAQVWPFEHTLHWPQEIVTANGPRAMDTYHRWMEVVIYATLAGLPVLSIPAGFSPEGLPMGIQLIGKPQGEVALILAGRAYEQQISDWLSIKPQALNPVTPDGDKTP
jgi:amidase